MASERPGDLSPAEAGFVLAAALLGAPRLGDALASGGRRCAAALETWALMPPDVRSGELARRKAQQERELPRSLERLHPGWLREAMEGESSSVLRAITVGLPTAVTAVADEIIAARGEDAAPRPADTMDGPAVAALRRALFASLVDPSEDESVTADALAREGAQLLGRSLQGAPRGVVARAAAHVGEPWAAAVIVAATTGGAGRDRARALVASVDPADARIGVVTAIGLRALGARLTALSDDRALAIAQRLPPALGRLSLQARDRARGAR